MPKYTVFECDKCGVKKLEPELPDGWIYGLLTKNGGDPYRLDKRYVWCQPCAALVVERQSEAA
jgi:hypothetical protein